MAKNPAGKRNLARLAGGVLGGSLLTVAPALWATTGCQCTVCSDLAHAENKAFRIASLMGDDAAFTLGRWRQLGYHNESTGVFNTHPNALNLQ